MPLHDLQRVDVFLVGHDVQGVHGRGVAGMDHGLAEQAVRLVEDNLPDEPVEVGLNQPGPQGRAVGSIRVLKRGHPQRRDEKALGTGEVLPHRPADDPAAFPAQNVHDVADGVAHHGNVVDRQIPITPQPEHPGQVGGADAHRENGLSVLFEQAPDGQQRPDTHLAVNDLGRLQHRHRPQPPADRLARAGDIAQQVFAGVLAELRQDEARQRGVGGAEPSDEGGNLVGRADADEHHREVLAALGKGAQGGNHVVFGGGDLGVGDRVLQAQDHGGDAQIPLGANVAGKLGTGSRAVEGRPQSRREQGRVAVVGHLARGAMEQLPRLVPVEEREVAQGINQPFPVSGTGGSGPPARRRRCGGSRPRAPDHLRPGVH